MAKFRFFYVAMACLLTAVGCKPKSNQNSDTETEVPKALYGTWILSDTDEAVPSVVNGGLTTTITYRTHLKIEPTQATYLVYCESPDLGHATSVGVATATITPTTLFFGRPDMKPTAHWCDAAYAAMTTPVEYRFVNDALHIKFEGMANGKTVLQRAK